MAVLAKQSSTRLSRFGRRFIQYWRTLFAPGDWVVLLITALLLIIPVLSLNVVGWPLAMETVIPITLLSVLLGFMLARSQYNEFFALIMSGIYGLGIVTLIASINEPGNLVEGIGSLFSRVLRWLMDAASGGINQDELILTLLISGLFWFLGYNIVWHVFRIDRVWRAIMPPALILVTNSIYAPPDKPTEGYIALFMFLALLLVVRSNLDAREWDWYVNGIRVPRKLRQQFLRVGAVLALATLLIAWLIPTANLQERLNRFQEFLQNEPLTQLSEFWNRLFASADLQGPTTADYYGGDSLQLGGAIQLGEQVVLLVNAPPGRRYYWRSRVFDTYESGRWTPAADTRLTDPEAPLQVVQEGFVGSERVPVQQEFTIGLSASRLVYTAPQPAQVNLATRTDLRYTPEEMMNISVIRPLKVLYQGESYTTTSLLSNATAAQLRSAGVEYPDWIRDLYLYVSPSITSRTRDLARTIVNNAGAFTPYDQAKALEGWLRANIVYNETIPQPPAGQDPVDWVLFDMREGYCNYYASSMIMMLRSLGVPARMAAGFSQGEWDAEQQAYTVRERDAHTWVEVYFPGYGWIEFEPTAAQAPLNRVDDQEIAQQPTPTPFASPTPTATPTPSPSPTTDPAAQVPPDEGRTIPSPTPTYTPSPTATPVIVPTQPPPIRPQPRGPLSFILPALGLALLGLLVIAILVALGTFIWWWWEWRGMGGLSPITRAYARLERYAALLGIKLAIQQTPEERRRRILREIPAAEPPVTAITRMYSVERYGRPAQPASGEAADKAWVDARENILKRFLRRFIPWAKK
jgi:transglutaminase-like putative cysteine protease